MKADGNKQDFVTLDKVFKKIEVVNAVADDVVYKKKMPALLEPFVVGTPSKPQQNTSERKQTIPKKTYNSQDLEGLRSKIKQRGLK